jgi:hypothetical protein
VTVSANRSWVSPDSPPLPLPLGCGSIAGDHGWVDDGMGVLSCVAGDEYSATQVVACPYYLRHDVVARLPGAIRAGRSTVTWNGHCYYKITQLADPQNWRALVAALPIEHGVRPFAWSLFSGVDRAVVAGTLDPRDALCAALHHYAGTTHSAGSLLGTLAERLGDCRNHAGSLGLTGSAALDLARLGRGGDVDLIVYPLLEPTEVIGCLEELGARFLPDLATVGDSRVTVYRSSRLMPPLTDAVTSRTLLARRMDVAWIGRLRLDLTFRPQDPVQVPEVRYAVPPAGRIRGRATVTSISDGYPVHLSVESPRIEHLLVTARGYQGALRVGDRVRFAATLHRPGEAATYASLDDACGHTLSLATEGQP